MRTTDTPLGTPPFPATNLEWELFGTMAGRDRQRFVNSTDTLESLVHGACSPRVPAPSSRCVADRLFRFTSHLLVTNLQPNSDSGSRVSTYLHTGQYEVQKCSWFSSVVQEVLQLSHCMGNVSIAGDNYPPCCTGCLAPQCTNSLQ